MGLWIAELRAVACWNRNIKLFFAMNVLFQAGTGMFSVLYNLYVQSLGYGQVLNGRLISVASFATALMFIPLGLAGDRFGRRGLLLAGVLGTGLASIGRSFAAAPGSLELYALLGGLFASALQVLAVPFLADNSRKEERLKLLSYHFAATLAAQVLGSAGGGALADLLQAAGTGRIASLQAALAAGSGAVLTAAFPLLGMREGRRSAGAETAAGTRASMAVGAGAIADEADAGTAGRIPGRPPEAAEADDPAREPGAAGAATDRLVIVSFAFTQLLIGIGSGLVIPYLNLYFTDRFDASLTLVGVLISLGQVMTVISMLLGPRLVKRIGPVGAILFFQLLSLPFLLITGLTQSLAIATVGYLFRQALMNAANPIHSSILVERVSARRRGTANSINQTMFMLGWAFMGYVQPAILDRYGAYWGYAVTFCLTGALYAVSAACFYFMFRERRREAERLKALTAGASK